MSTICSKSKISHAFTATKHITDSVCQGGRHAYLPQLYRFVDRQSPTSSPPSHTRPPRAPPLPCRFPSRREKTPEQTSLVSTDWCTGRACPGTGWSRSPGRDCLANVGLKAMVQGGQCGGRACGSESGRTRAVSGLVTSKERTAGEARLWRCF